MDNFRILDPDAATVPGVLLLTAHEVAEILGIDVQTVYQYASERILNRHAPSHVRQAYDHDEIEARSLSRLTHLRHPPHHYWVGCEEAADELGVTRSAVRQMMLADRLPYVTAPNGRRYVRRHQLDVIANVLEVRRHRVRARAAMTSQQNQEFYQASGMTPEGEPVRFASGPKTPAQGGNSVRSVKASTTFRASAGRGQYGSYSGEGRYRSTQVMYQRSARSSLRNQPFSCGSPVSAS